MINSTCNNSYGLYIHIPFCISKCFYCNFYSVVDLSKVDSYFLALNSELELYKNKGYSVDTIYFGGGTPSLVETSYIEIVLETIYKHFRVVAAPEITIEINPGTVRYSDLLRYYLVGINRLSIGIQSICNDHLLFLGRSHNTKQSLNTFCWAKEIGFDNVGVDLIYGLPGQNFLKWQKEIGKIITLRPEHLSCYLLTLEPKTPIGDKVLDGRLTPCGDGLIKSMFIFTNRFLRRQGYHQYEVSNFSRIVSGDIGIYESKHNKKYWNSHNYIGIGASAHSLRDNRRWWNHSCVNRYIDDTTKHGVLPIAGIEDLTVEQRITEFIYLGLRQHDGVDIVLFEKKFKVSIFHFFTDQILILLEDKFIRIYNDRMMVTEKGLSLLESLAILFCL